MDFFLLWLSGFPVNKPGECSNKSDEQRDKQPVVLEGVAEYQTGADHVGIAEGHAGEEFVPPAASPP